MSVLTTAQLAALIGVSPRRLRAIAQARGVRPLLRNVWRKSDLRKLKPGKPGRPRQ